MADTPALDLAQSFTAFGPFLRYLRRRARLTQRELSIAVGYSMAQICLLEKGQRNPDLTTVAALFVPALGVQNEPALAARLLHLAAVARGIPATHAVRDEPAAMRATPDPSITGSRRAIPRLPAPMLPLIGRASEMSAVRSLLLSRPVRLLTLVGPPGVGKTRLALQLAWAVDAAFADGARFVDLAAIDDPALVAPALAQALDIPGAGMRETDVQAALRDVLRARQMLLVLDNFEQVVPAAALVTDLLAAAPDVRILVTSRTALRVYGEHEFPVPTLALPALEALPPLEALAQIPSVALFVARAQAVWPGFTLHAANALAVAEICVRLDGLPLAIELAAAQSKLFTPQELAARLVRRNPRDQHDTTGLRVLARGPRDAPARHQTLLGAIDWSYRLLAPGEQHLLAWLGVFVDGFTLEAVEAVCREQGAASNEQHVPVPDHQPPEPILDALTALVNKSLVQRHERAGETRFALLETIREYALDQLVARGAFTMARRRHAEYFTALAAAADAHIRSPEQEAWLCRLDDDYANLRAALAWCQSEPGEAERLVRLAGALAWFWFFRGLWNEGYQWLSEALEAADRLEPKTDALRHAQNQALRGAAYLAYFLEDAGQSWAYYERNLALSRELGDQPAAAFALIGLTHLLTRRRDYRQAASYADAALDLARQCGDAGQSARAALILGELARLQHDYEQAQQHYQEGLASARQADDTLLTAVLLQNLGQVMQQQGDFAGAWPLHVEGLRLYRKLGFYGGMAFGLEKLAGVAGALGQPEKAARLLGAAEALRETMRSPMDEVDRDDYDVIVARARAALDEAAFRTAWAEGRTLPLEQALAYAASRS